jgi:LCP family protein required for cell wall assembly
MGIPSSGMARREALYRRRRQALLIASCLLMASLGAAAGLLGRLSWRSLSPLFGSGSHLRHAETLLVAGLGPSTGKGKSRMDTLMVVTLKPGDRLVEVLSIPRDTQVLVPGYGTAKLEAAYQLGGLGRTREAIEAILDRSVDHTVLLDTAAVAKLVDRTGGLDLFVEQAMHYQDHAGGLTIDFKPGWHHMSGPDAVRFARYRHDPLGDLDRVMRQQLLLHAWQRKLAAPSSWWRLPDLTRDLSQVAKSDLSFGKIADEVGFLHDHPAVRFATLPGDFDANGYWIPNHARIVAMNQKLNGDRPARIASKGPNPTVEVLFAPAEETIASRLAERLTDKGLVVVRTSIMPTGSTPITRIVGRNENPVLDPTLAKLLPDAPWMVNDDPSPYSADYTVVVGPDHR